MGFFNWYALGLVSKNKRSWVVNGLIFGVIMYLVLFILKPLLFEEMISDRSPILGLVVIPFGLVYGYVEKVINNSSDKES